jgi:hypothetical protein
MFGRPILTQAVLNNYAPQLAVQDIIWSPLYDSANYSTAGQTQITFFAVPQGQGVTTAPSGVAGSAKTALDTNLQSAGQLTLGNAFFAVGQELLFFPGLSPNEGAATPTATANFLNDVYSFGKDGLLTLTVGSNRTYIQDGPLGVFPPASYIATAVGLAAIGPTSQATIQVYESDYAVWSGEIYSIEPLFFQANLGFQETLTWGSSVALPSGKAARIFTRLRGYLIRLAQ